MISNRWKILAAALPIIGTLAMAQPQPGGLGGFYQAYYGSTYAQGAGFSPASIDGLMLWLDGTDESTKTLGSIGGFDNLIDQWDDKSGNNYHAGLFSSGGFTATANASTQPSNVLNGVYFNGNDLLVIKTNDIGRFTRHIRTFIVMDRPVEKGSGHYPFSLRNGTGNALRYGIRIEQSVTNGVELLSRRLDATTQPTVGFSNTIISQKHVLDVHSNYDIAELQMRALPNGGGNTNSAWGTTGESSDTPSVYGAVGTYASTALGFLGTIYELIIYHSDLTAQEEQDLLDYLYEKHGITP